MKMTMYRAYITTGMNNLFQDYDNYIKRFTRDLYPEAFVSFCEKHQDFYEVASKPGFDFSTCGRQLAASFQELLDREPSRNRKASLQMNGNLFMAVYVLPAFAEKFSGEEVVPIWKALTDAWEEAFPGNRLEGAGKDRILEGFRKKLCYITTAVCENRCLSPNCEELQLIRDFRDHYMAGFEEGRELIDAYYDIAPTIVKRINKTTDPKSIYDMLWQEYIRPCVDRIKEGDLSGCMSIYCRMVDNLRELFIYHYKRG